MKLTVFNLYLRLNQKILILEKFIIVISVVSMSLLVFCDVLQRALSRLDFLHDMNAFGFLLTGIPGAQKFALGFMMWAAFLGASVAVNQKRHLILGALKSKVNDNMAPYFALISGLVASGFCFYLGYLAFLQFQYEYADWVLADGVGVFEALPIPLWVVTLAIPTSLFIMATRFFAQGLFVCLGFEQDAQQEAH